MALLRVAVGARPRLHLHPADRDRRSTPSTSSNDPQKWPPPGLHPRLVPEGDRKTSPPAKRFFTSIKAGLAATAIAIVLGTLASLAVARHRFFGRETISFLVILPIALPGIVTGVALSNTFTQVLGDRPQPLHGDRRPRHLLHRRRLQQRRRPPAPHLGLLRGGLGRPRRRHLADLPLRHPSRACARPSVAGALLAFALSFDEIIVTTFTIGAGEETLPIWIFRNLFRPNQLPIVNAVAVIVILISIIPVYLAHRLQPTRAAHRPAAAREPRRGRGHRRPLTS